MNSANAVWRDNKSKIDEYKIGAKIKQFSDVTLVRWNYRVHWSYMVEASIVEMLFIKTVLQFRFFFQNVSANKYWTSIRAIDGVFQSLEWFSQSVYLRFWQEMTSLHVLLIKFYGFSVCSALILIPTETINALLSHIYFGKSAHKINEANTSCIT